jgi:hypothetical protein
MQNKKLAYRISCSPFPGESWHLQPEYMIPVRLPWRHRARPSATLHEIQVRSEERTVRLNTTAAGGGSQEYLAQQSPTSLTKPDQA